MNITWKKAKVHGMHHGYSDDGCLIVTIYQKRRGNHEHTIHDSTIGGGKRTELHQQARKEATRVFG